MGEEFLGLGPPGLAADPNFKPPPPFPCWEVGGWCCWGGVGALASFPSSPEIEWQCSSFRKKSQGQAGVKQTLDEIVVLIFFALICSLLHFLLLQTSDVFQNQTCIILTNKKSA